jgi:hypothetical protein
MDLSPYVESLRRDLQAAADVAGPDARVVADRLLGALDASVRLVLIDALGAAAEQITSEMAPGSVELRLRGREPEFVVSAALPPEPPAPVVPPGPPAPPLFEGDDTTARISLRLPDGLKSRIEEAANEIGFSVNSWLVRALNDAVTDINQRTTTREHRRDIRPGRNLSGWVR